ncbi:MULTISPECIES: uroporphyrinogen decarboxylase [unclassified Roseitalea]|uniref:uroporphyrinogen decarboxylase n=1 Tax=unclassified Roseitalea TaxID=2639107 RepID=UPI00273D0323|nr:MULTISPECIES: uroporphyrinogen decarboxylase [unclassified Roseitalea]
MAMATRNILKVMQGETVNPPPIWVMRQAGRYLPEYRQTRAQAKSFLDFCYTPDLAVEATMQPIRRYGFDAAILFADILLIPDALKRDVTFVQGEGPRMRPLEPGEVDTLSIATVTDHLAPVFETVRRLRADLPEETTLLGFCGAPWTVATYMIAGRGTADQAPARMMLYREPAELDRLLDLLAEASARYLVGQLDAGADAVKIFDSWAAVLDEAAFERCCVRPVRRIIEMVRAERPGAKVIAFPKGAGYQYRGYREKTGADMVALDWTVPLDIAAEMQKEGPVQGNLDPLRVVAGRAAIREGVDRILEALSGGPFVFNLGHGITPQADPDDMAYLVDYVRGQA